VRIAWLLLFFPSFAFAVMGCPVGVQLGNVTMATRLPFCLKFDGSELGGCSVDCKEICVELPLANTKGPVQTTGGACSLSDNGSGDGDSDGSGNTPGEGSSGTKPIDGWIDFQPVVGDATGTSVSGSVAKLNKNLGLAFRQLMDGTKRDSDNINSITHSAESLSRDMKAALYHLDRMSNDVFQTKNNGAELLGRVNTSNEYLNAINTKLDKVGETSGNTGGTTGGGDAETGDDFDQQSLFRMLEAINDNISHTGGDTARNSGDLLQAFYSLQQQLASGDAGGSQQGGGEGAGGTDIDYSKMPGSEATPLSVRSASYDSKGCEGGANCFFDLATMQGKLDKANNALTGSYKAISEDMKRIFSFNFYGSAEPMKCLDLFTLYGKDYSVCPPSSDFWSTLAALMMFIFYFVALMVIFKM
jgi:hypothetical protein